MKILPFQQKLIDIIRSKERFTIFLPRKAGRTTVEKMLNGHTCEYSNCTGKKYKIFEDRTLCEQIEFEVKSLIHTI